MSSTETNVVYHCDVLTCLQQLDSASVDLIYTDPPFNTGQLQTAKRSGISYLDSRNDYIDWCKAWVQECYRVLKPTGTLYLHLNEQSAYKVRFLVLDEVFGPKNYMNTIIWHWDFGGASKRCWRAKHESILVYAKQFGQHIFNYDELERVPYLAGQINKSQSRNPRGKVLTDVWWMSIVGTNAKERVGYPNQKPIKLIERIIKASAPNHGIVLDPFAGSGTTGEAAHNTGRSFILCDSNSAAVQIMEKRFKNIQTTFI